jgi:hypothetical protein
MTRLRIAVALSLVLVALSIGPLDEGAEAARGAAGTIPSNCGVGILTPVKHQGLLAAAQEAECNAPIPYFRVNVSLMILVDGLWRRRASAIGETPVLASPFNVQVAAPCRHGRHRSDGVVKYRFDTSDPWTLMIRWHSPSWFFRWCPSHAA